MKEYLFDGEDYLIFLVVHDAWCAGSCQLGVHATACRYMRLLQHSSISPSVDYLHLIGHHGPGSPIMKHHMAIWKSSIQMGDISQATKLQMETHKMLLMWWLQQHNSSTK